MLPANVKVNRCQPDTATSQENGDNCQYLDTQNDVEGALNSNCTSIIPYIPHYCPLLQNFELTNIASVDLVYH